ncbi:Frataxin/CyaY [Pseudocohnilembus persalinus]|uniref:Frataxin/CyaY n=1 Tax=Pseudocohnilembus persalinus TaxID=266149 RepID=A0A0V0QTL3_PSEPJ|nr:Frataxin/CyaY [Pseudocohnilembus persalinus]|eukprot:KRX05322.1 Frataxin/CyaY [Pseudocohnilembus persalinus]
MLQNVNRLRSKSKKLEVEIPHIEKDIYLEQANLLLFQLSNGFEKLSEFDDRIKDIEFEESNNGQQLELRLNIEHLGQYRWVTEAKDRVIYFNSPFSGIYKYYYDQELEQWKNTKDLHILQDTLIREITHHCKGYLDL